VVTGAAGDVAQAVYRQLADRGASLVAVDLDEPAQTQAFLAQAGHTASAPQVDVSDPR
jgi:3-oxoacyl-[acyl-carrier protein] reductase